MNKKRLFRFAASAESVVRQGLGAMFARRRRVVAGLGNCIALATVGFVPRGLVLGLVEKVVR